MLRIYNDGLYKIVSFFGVKIKIKRKSWQRFNILTSQLEQLMQRIDLVANEQRDCAQLINSIYNQMNELKIHFSYEIEDHVHQANVSKLHSETFGRYKNAFAGKDVVLLATGPSLKYFKPIDNAVYIGVNGAFRYDKIKLDYLFAQDYSGLHYVDEMADCPATKFYGILSYDNIVGNGRSVLIPECIATRHNAHRYFVRDVGAHKLENYAKFSLDITSVPLDDYNSVIFPAMQFILYGNPRRIYLVGCDTSASGYFDVGVNNLNINLVKHGWQKLREFSKACYPETEIVSINPVGLKGLFVDKFDKNFLLEQYCNKEYEDQFLIGNRMERMDAYREDIFRSDRATFHKDRYEFAAKYIKDKDVLDVASGLGYGADLMNKQGQPTSVTGVELDTEAFVYSEKNYSLSGKVSFLQGSILNLPFEDNTFDVLTSFETIEHVEDEALQIQNIKRVLKPNGLYILSTPNDWDNTNNPHHVRDYDYESIKKLITDNFETIEIFNHNSGGEVNYNHAQPRGIIKTTEENYKNAECFIIVARNNKGDL